VRNATSKRVLSKENIWLKGQQRDILLLWLFSSVEPIWAPAAFTIFSSNSVSNFALFEFEIRSALWATAGN
jgi:hypothetical protein